MTETALPKSAVKFRKLLDRAGLSQMAASRALDLGPRTVRSYALGEREPPLVVDLALRFLAEHPATEK